MRPDGSAPRGLSPRGDPNSLASHPPVRRVLELAADAPGAAARLAAQGKRVIGLVCPNLPEELPHALGLTPVRIVVRPEPVVRSPEVLQTFCCTWVQALLDQALRGQLAPLHGLTFPCNTCDSLQNLPDIWRHTVERPGPEALFSLRLPVVNEGEAALGLLRAEIDGWTSWLEARAGAPLEPARLAASARLFNRVRAALRRLQQLAAQGQIGYSLVQAAALASQTHDRAEIADLLDQITEIAAVAPRAGEARARVVLAGGYLDDTRLLEWLEERDAAVVDDDSCAISRTFEPAVDLDPQEPLADLARRHLRRSRCPVQLGSGTARRDTLVQKIRRAEAQGAILLPYKGCEPHAFDNVILAEELSRLGLPHITLEIEPHLGSWGQLTTRLEAFLEMFSVVDDDLFDDSPPRPPHRPHSPSEVS